MSQKKKRFKYRTKSIAKNKYKWILVFRKSRCKYNRKKQKILFLNKKKDGFR